LTVVGGGLPAPRPEIRAPARHNPALVRILERVNADVELWTLWKCANVNAVDRMGTSDHGWVHVQIVANLGLKLMRLLMDAGIQPGVVLHHGLGRDEAEVVVVLGALLHDLGVAAHPQQGDRASFSLAHQKLRELLADSYDVATRTVIFAEALHVVLAQRRDAAALTREAGAVRVADALDMAKGRSRTAGMAGTAIEAVEVRRGATRPVTVEVVVSGGAGVVELEEALRREFMPSGLLDYLELKIRVAGAGAVAAPDSGHRPA
ncbi:MAG: HD domain-containing protein, partial [Chloroflexi bacterium]|nr:HD domain-containing protein [Chloroflexota bacterium]